MKGGLTRSQRPTQVGHAPATMRAAALLNRQPTQVESIAARDLDQVSERLVFTVAAINVDHIREEYSACA